MRAIILIVAIVFLGLGPSAADADPQGPFCFSTEPFSDIFAFFLQFNGGNQFIATGRNLSTNSGITATLFLTGNFAVLSFVAPASPVGHSALGTADLDLSTGSGPAVCETVNTSEGCGSGTSFTLALTACPPDTTSSTDAATRRGRRLMGGSR